MIIDLNSLPQSPLFEGGEGFIYKRDHQCLKIYKPHVDKRKKEKKVLALLSKKLPSCAVVPVEAVYDINRNFVGFLMPWVQGEECKRLSSRSFVKMNHLGLSQILSILLKAKDAIKLLHAQGVVIGDLNDCNISFDLSGNIYFLDTDSWAVDSLSCDVCMDSFKDPLLKGNLFTKATDFYAFAVLAFKCLTRLHPFGGTTVPDRTLLERMAMKTSVLGQTKIAIPKNIVNWKVFSPTLLEAFRVIFDENKRTLLDAELEELANHLSVCVTHGGQYFSKYTTCPVCDNTANLQTKPLAMSPQGGIPYRVLRSFTDVDVFVDSQHYINNFGDTVHILTGKTGSAGFGEIIRFSNDGHITYRIFADSFRIENGLQQYTISKAFKTLVHISDRKAYYVDDNLTLCEITVDPKGNFVKPITKVSPRHQYACHDAAHFASVSFYDHMSIFQIDGHYYTLQDRIIFSDTFIFRDAKFGHWLIIGQRTDGSHHLFVFDKGTCLIEQKQIKISADMEVICYNNGILFMPSDGRIRGYQLKENNYKDFLVDCVLETSKLTHQTNKSKFICLNPNTSYEIG